MKKLIFFLAAIFALLSCQLPTAKAIDLTPPGMELAVADMATGSVNIFVMQAADAEPDFRLCHWPITDVQLEIDTPPLLCTDVYRDTYTQENITGKLCLQEESQQPFIFNWRSGNSLCKKRIDTPKLAVFAQVPLPYFFDRIYHY